ncbi:MAG: hypothetical protein VB144_06330 [Clostridia bacterium]|nr:hypothetical protein [Clostridia bacterium]
MEPSRLIDYTLRRDLESDPRLSLVDARVYGAIAHADPVSCVQICTITGLNRETVGRSVHRLSETGWIGVEQVVPRTRESRMRFILSAPPHTQKAIAKHIDDFRWRAPRAGEYLMLVWLDLLVVSLSYQNNARPRFLANPPTGYPLELDRLYVEDNVALEFNGRQHYEETSLFGAGDELSARQTRDLAKLALCKKEGITLVEVTENDLSYEGMVAKASPHIRVRRIDQRGDVMKTVSRLSSMYRSNCIRARNVQKSRAAKADHPVDENQGPVPD